jgi:hypothetical protein
MGLVLLPLPLLLLLHLITMNKQVNSKWTK